MPNNLGPRLQAGDTFQFVSGTTDTTWREAPAEQFDANTTFVVLRAESTYGGDKFGLESRKGPWKVWAAPRGTRVEDLGLTTIVFFQPDDGQKSGQNRILILNRDRRIRPHGIQADQTEVSGDGRGT